MKRTKPQIDDGLSDSGRKVIGVLTKFDQAIRKDFNDLGSAKKPTEKKVQPKKQKPVNIMDLINTVPT
jgi:hypothetical protein